MLFEYFPSEEQVSITKKVWVKEIRKHICSIFLIQLIDRGTPETVNVIAQYLCPDIARFNKIKDVLHVIAQYQNKISKALKENIFEKNIISSSKSKSQGNCFLASIFMVMYHAIIQKQQPKSDIQEGIMEEVIAASINVLFSLNWILISGQLLTTHSTPQHYSVMIHQSKNEYGKYYRLAQKILKFLKNSNVQETFEINILSWMLQIPYTGLKKEKQEYQHFLGTLTYKSMLKKIMNNESSSLNFEIEDIYSIIEGSEINVNFATSLFGKIMGSINSFEVGIHETIFNGLKLLIENPLCFSVIFQSEDLFNNLLRFIINGDYTSNKVIKGIIVDFITRFMTFTWNFIQMTPTITRAFLEWQKLTIQDFCALTIRLISRLILTSQTVENENGVFHLIELVYTLEDFASSHPQILIEEDFIKALTIFILLLDKTGMLYFWYPSFGPQAFEHDISFEYDSHCSQREGGIVRVILKLLFGTLLKNNGECDLLLQNLRFFIFHEEKYFSKLAKYVQKDQKILLDLWECVPISFLSISSEIMHKITIQMKEKLNHIKEEKSVAQQKTVSFIASTIKDVFDSGKYKTLLLFTSIMQIIIYEFYGINQYQHLDFTEICSRILSEKCKHLIIIIGEMIGCHPDFINQLENEIDTRIAKLFRLQIKNCFTDAEMIPKVLIQSIYSDFSSGYAAVKDGSKQVEYDPKAFQTKLESPQNTPDLNSLVKAFKQEFKYLLTNIQNDWTLFQAQKQTKEEYIKKFLTHTMKQEMIQKVQAGLHDLFSEDYKYIDKAIYLLAFKRESIKKKQSESFNDAIGYGSSRIRLCNRLDKVGDLEKILQQETNIYMEFKGKLIKKIINRYERKRE